MHPCMHPSIHPSINQSINQSINVSLCTQQIDNSLFVSVEVLRSSQPDGVMSSAVTIACSLRQHIQYSCDDNKPLTNLTHLLRSSANKYLQIYLYSRPSFSQRTRDKIFYPKQLSLDQRSQKMMMNVKKINK